MLVLQSYDDCGYETLTQVYSTSLFICMIECEGKQSMASVDVQQINDILESQGKVSYIINGREVTLYNDSFEQELN